MQKRPFFTVLTAALNCDATIAQTLNSVKNQTYQNFEHIVLDGKSRDKTCDILKHFETEYNLSWISEPDKGIAQALNKGLNLATGKYIYVLGADDYLINSKILDETYELIKDELYDIFSSPVILNHPSRGKINFKPNRILWWYHFKTIFPHQGSFVHQRMFRKVRKFREDISIAFDYDFFYRMLQLNPRVKYGTKPIAMMSGTGVSCNRKHLIKRLNEEYLIQISNETRMVWKILQMLFRTMYFPYKTKLVPKLQHLTYQR